jgi:hypothetical protein
MEVIISDIRFFLGLYEKKDNVAPSIFTDTIAVTIIVHRCDYTR